MIRSLHRHANVYDQRREMRREMLLTVFASILLCAASTVGADRPKVPFGDYTAFEVENFENPRYETKEPMPDDWLPIIREDIVQQVIRKHQFRRVMDFEDLKVPPPEIERVLLLRGRIIEFTQGSQAMRFLVGFGAGRGKIVAMCTFVDEASGEVIWERKVDGSVIGFGQATEGGIQGLAKEVAKRIRANR